MGIGESNLAQASRELSWSYGSETADRVLQEYAPYRRVIGPFAGTGASVAKKSLDGTYDFRDMVGDS